MTRQDYRTARDALRALPAAIIGSQQASAVGVVGHHLREALPWVIASLLNLEDRFATPGFAELRTAALVAAVVAVPAPALDCLYRHFYSREDSDGVRHDVLAVVIAAAKVWSWCVRMCRRSFACVDGAALCDVTRMGVDVVLRPPASLAPCPCTGVVRRASCVVCRVSCVVCRVSCVVCRVSCVVSCVVSCIVCRAS